MKNSYCHFSLSKKQWKHILYLIANTDLDWKGLVGLEPELCNCLKLNYTGICYEDFKGSDLLTF